MNLPIELNHANLMIIGIGGGFDIFSGLPLAFNHNTVEASFLCSIARFLVNSSPASDFLVKESTKDDYPEGLIGDYPCFTVGRHGVGLVSKAYKRIVKDYQISCVIAVDGGVDSLMQGDEKNSGTILEDFISLAAISELQCKKVLCCAGFGTETEESLNHYCVLENIAALIKDGCFLGSCSLTPWTNSYNYYKEVCERVMESGRKSHIQGKIISAVEGEFGDYHKYEDVDARVFGESNDPYFISPLMGIYWFFDLMGVVARNKLIGHLKSSNTFADAKVLLSKNKNFVREKKVIPL